MLRPPSTLISLETAVMKMDGRQDGHMPGAADLASQPPARLIGREAELARLGVSRISVGGAFAFTAGKLVHPGLPTLRQLKLVEHVVDRLAALVIGCSRQP